MGMGGGACAYTRAFRGGGRRVNPDARNKGEMCVCVRV
jgi:hypothetical protein